jgi:hypothetical protein
MILCRRKELSDEKQLVQPKVLPHIDEMLAIAIEGSEFTDDGTITRLKR